MKNYLLIGLLITQSISLIHIRHLEASKKNREFTLFYNRNEAPVFQPVINTAPAELLPPIESFEDALNSGPSADLFPEVAQAKPIKKKR